MTAPVTISGLSGINTTTVIAETLAAASAPQQAEQKALQNLQVTDSAYQAINSAMAAIKTAADTVSLPATWQSTTATSSDTSIVATGTTAAQAGTSTTFTVNTLAAGQTSAIRLADPTNADSASSGIQIQFGTNPATTITPTDNTAAALVTAVNAKNIGVKAALITATDSSGNPYTVLQFTSTTTGTASAFTVSGLTAGSTTTSGVTTANTMSNLSTASNASITVGASGGYSISSSTNTFVNAIPGVSFTVSKASTSATISITNNPTVASNAVSAMVSAVNAALGIISTNTGQGSTLEGDTLATNLTSGLLSAFSAGGPGGTTYDTAGLDLTSFGTFDKFNIASFTAAYTANPASLQTLLTNLSTQFSAIGDAASNVTSGSLTQAIASDATQEASLTSEISDWTDKLAQQKTALQNKYAAMDAALSKLQSEQSFLSSAFGGSSSSSSSSSGMAAAGVSSN